MGPPAVRAYAARVTGRGYGTSRPDAHFGGIFG
jgi:hypothetical protein